MKTNEVVLVDLSSIAYPIWHMSQAEADPNRASQQIVARVRALAAEHPHAAICCDMGRSFRHTVDPQYKANRPEHEAVLHHQIDLAKEALAADGFPVWGVKGFEADDLIATATTQALTMRDLDVLVVSADKDLLQLVGPRVRVKSARDGAILDEAGVRAKLFVEPTQIRDYLTLVGDTADNIKGVKGIGPKKASELLAKFGSLDEVYRRLAEVGAANAGIPAAVAAALKEFQPSLDTTRKLVTLRTDVEIPFAEIANDRIAQTAARVMEMDVDEEAPAPPVAAPTDPAPATDAAPTPAAGPHPVERVSPSTRSGDTALAVRDGEVLAPPPAEWERQLDPRSMKEAVILSNHMVASCMFSDYGTPQAVLSTIMVGRELGLPAMASLRAIHNIKGKHGLSASLMVALILKSGLATYFRPVTISDTEATFTTLRKGPDQSPFTLTHTIEMAKTAGLLKPDSNWHKIPTDMLVARAQSRLARLMYPDLLAGLYTPEELREIRDEEAA